MEIKIFNHSQKVHLFTVFDSCKPTKKHMFRIHNHTMLEFGFIKFGDAQYHLGSHQYAAKSGMMFLIKPGEQHCVPTIHSNHLSSINIHVNSYYLWNTMLDYISPLALHQLLNGDETSHIWYDFEKYFNELDEILHCEQLTDLVYIKTRRTVLKLIIDICDKLHSDIQEKELSSAPSSGFFKIQKAISYIDNNYAEKITIPQLLEVSNLNKTIFSNSFKKYTGLSAIEYVTIKRLDKATELLKHSQNNIIDIALECGFNNISHFNRIFKSKFEITPKEYRKSFT